MTKFSAAFLMITLCAFKLCAQGKLITVNTQRTSLILQTDKENRLLITHYGRKLRNEGENALLLTTGKPNPANDDLSVADEAYIGSGSVNLLEPAITVTHANGDNALALKYERNEVTHIDNNRSLTKVLLKDGVYDLEVTLYFLSYFKEDVIEQWSTIKNAEKGNVLLSKYASANLPLNADKFYLKNFTSNWAQEMENNWEELKQGIKILDSKQGVKTNLLQSSSFLVALNRPSTEIEGEVIAGSLAYTGNFRLDFEISRQEKLRIVPGINNFASPYTLKPKEVFETPKFIYTYSSTGNGQASRNLHDWTRNYILVNGKDDRHVLLNNWETTYFKFDDEKLRALVQDTKKLGADLFLLDDGWFGEKYPRNDAKAGLGDWQVNKQKLKNGLGNVIKETTANGLKFGIWIEPEMVNPKSELYEQHPDWVLRAPGRPEFYMRNQLVLDLSNPKVQDFVFRSVDDLFVQNPGIAYIKWDCNSSLTNAHSPTISNQNHLYIEYARGLNSVFKRLRAKYPKVDMMLCASGGGRVDYSALQYFTEFWPSDNTDPLDRIFIQWGYSYFFPSIAVAAHVTNWGKQPLKYKVDVAMMGKLGFDIQVNDLKDQELSFCQQAIKNFNDIKHIIYHGDQFRLKNPTEGNKAAMLYVTKDQKSAVMFNFLNTTRYNIEDYRPIRLQGLDPVKNYRLKEINLYPGTKSEIDGTKLYSGDFLMNIGVDPEVNNRRSSVIITLEEV